MIGERIRSTLFLLLAVAACTVPFGTAGAGIRVSLSPNTWHQLSYPGELANATVRQLFGGVLAVRDYGTRWTVYVFSPGAQRYVDPGLDGTIGTGRGFWIMQMTDRTVTLDSDNVPYAVGRQRTGCYADYLCTARPLVAQSGGAGWNMVGNPFDAAVDTGDATIRTRVAASRCENACTLEQASNRGVVSPALWHYDGTADRYVDYAGATIPPWGGFWVGLDRNGRNASSQLLLPDPYCS